MRTCLVRWAVRGSVRGTPGTVTVTLRCGPNDFTRLQPVLAGLLDPRELAGDQVPPPEEWRERLVAVPGVVLAQAWSAACSTATSTLGATSDPAVDAPG